MSQTEKGRQGLQGSQRVRCTEISEGERLRTESPPRLQRRHKPGEEAVPGARVKEDDSGTTPGMGRKEIQTHTPTPTPSQYGPDERSVGGQLRGIPSSFASPQLSFQENKNKNKNTAAQDA